MTKWNMSARSVNDKLDKVRAKTFLERPEAMGRLLKEHGLKVNLSHFRMYYYTKYGIFFEVCSMTDTLSFYLVLETDTLLSCLNSVSSIDHNRVFKFNPLELDEKDPRRKLIEKIFDELETSKSSDKPKEKSIRDLMMGTDDILDYYHSILHEPDDEQTD